MMRIVAWSLLAAAATLTVVPPVWRPVTGFGHDLEHVAMFLVLGSAFGFAYRRHAYAIALALVLCAGLLELMQIPIAGRHARLSDFLVDALAACIGVAVSHWVASRVFVPSPTGRRRVG